MASTVVEATEHLIVESATAVVTSVATAATGEAKNIELNIAKEVISATDEDVPSLLDKFQDGLEDVVDEVVKGAGAAVEAVEQHPELIAEGALAVVIGVASVVQPELIAGEVALIGKMAADSAKKTITTIATDTSKKVVTAISQDLADDAKEEAAKDVADATARKLAEDGEVAKPAPIDGADSKAVPAEAAKDASTSSTPHASDAKVTPTPTVSPKGSTAAIAEPPKQTSSDVGNATETKPGSGVSTTTKDRTIAIEVLQEPSKMPTNGEVESSSSKPEQAPVSLKITLGPDGQVKAVTKGGATEESKIPVPAPVVEASKVVSVEKTTKTALAATEASAPVPQIPAVSVPSIEEVQDGSDVENKPKAIEGTSKAVESIHTPPALSVSQLLGISGGKSAETPESSKATNDTPKAIGTSKAVDSAHLGPQTANSAAAAVPKVARSATTAVQNLNTPGEAPKSSDALTIIPATSTSLGPAVVSAISNVSTVTSTSKTISQPAAQDGMVTISQESLDLLHSKIDNMHTTIQKITAVLAYHLPTPPAGPQLQKAIKSSEEEISEALASAVRPLSQLLPEILNTDNTTHPALIDPSAERPGAEKRTSVLAVFGRVLWPFGGDKVATVTATEVNTQRADVAS